MCVPRCLFIGEGWRLLVKEVLPETIQKRTEEEEQVLAFKEIYSIQHLTSRSRINKPPGTFIEAEAAESGGQVTGERKEQCER